MPFDPYLAASILISMNFSEKESLDLSTRPQILICIHISFCVRLQHMITERPHFCAMDVDIEYAFSHRFFSHKKNIWAPVSTGFQKTIATGFNIGA